MPTLPADDYGRLWQLIAAKDGGQTTRRRQRLQAEDTKWKKMEHISAVLDEQEIEEELPYLLDLRVADQKVATRDPNSGDRLLSQNANEDEGRQQEIPPIHRLGLAKRNSKTW